MDYVFLNGEALENRGFHHLLFLEINKSKKK